MEVTDCLATEIARGAISKLLPGALEVIEETDSPARSIRGIEND